jgi:hypothetical protein
VIGQNDLKIIQGIGGQSLEQTADLFAESFEILSRFA